MKDSELAVRAQAGDREAFGKLVRRYAAQARRVARAVLRDDDDADDAAQDAFLLALRNMGRFDAKRPFGPWLMRIVANAATDRLRREKLRSTDPIPMDARTSDPGPDVVTDLNALGRDLKEAIATLPERQRTALVLFDVEGYSHAEIAEILGVPSGTVRSDVFHARRTLREILASWKKSKTEAV